LIGGQTFVPPRARSFHERRPGALYGSEGQKGIKLANIRSVASEPRTRRWRSRSLSVKGARRGPKPRPASALDYLSTVFLPHLVGCEAPQLGDNSQYDRHSDRGTGCYSACNFEPRIAASGNVTESPWRLAIQGELVHGPSRLSRLESARGLWAGRAIGSPSRPRRRSSRNGLIECENTLPVVLHANDRPAILLGFVV
jgi:hypothetical protein